MPKSIREMIGQKIFLSIRYIQLRENAANQGIKSISKMNGIHLRTFPQWNNEISNTQKYGRTKHIKV